MTTPLYKDPVVSRCFVCNKNQGLAVIGAETKINKVTNEVPCNKCLNLMSQGIIFISVKEGNPDQRTGGWCVIEEEKVRTMPLQPEAVDLICKSRICFLVDSTYDKLGLPRGSKSDKEIN